MIHLVDAREKSSPSSNLFRARRGEKNRQVCLTHCKGEVS